MQRTTASYPSAADFLPDHPSLAAARRAAAGCRGCPLWKHATQTVFGRGIAHARLVLIGEQPGDQEDRSGKPFVGPAGRVLDRALQAARIERRETYVTNAVKHFKWEPRGKRRIHRKPDSREIQACFPWLSLEIELIKPDAVVCLGATAARALLGPAFRVTRDRGHWTSSAFAPKVLGTIHPSALLRLTDADEREAAFELFVADLKIAREALS
jgi:DNA polymerase